MKSRLLTILVIILTGIFVVISCKNTQTTAGYKPVNNSSSKKAWDGYTSWYKITKDKPNTGDPTGFIEKRHNGKEAYREIYINDIGAAINQGHAPYKYPEGTIVVKESYKNREAWLKKGNKILTIMIKQAEGTSPETGDWGFIMRANGKLSTGTSKWAKFCGGCHVYAAAKDHVFMNSDFIKSLQ